MDRFSGFQDRNDALEFLFGRIDYERATDLPYNPEVFKLDRMRQLLAGLGDPHDGMNFVHVAGTKGKGSTTAMVASILKHAGFKTGAYTSPHLDRVEERASIDGQPCSSEDLIALLREIRIITDEMDREVEAGCRSRGPTFFEITTALALLHFARKKVDVAVLEVGLGGRLDSTNVCQPMVSVITSISYDHLRQLGDTLPQIASEKAGIIKPNTPVVSGVTDAGPAEVIGHKAAQENAPLFIAGRDFDFDYTIENDRRTPQHQSSMRFVDRAGRNPWRLDELRVGLPGRHQAKNAALALATITRLREQGWVIPDDAARIGLADVRCPARVEVISREPLTIVDSAHNVASIEALVRTLQENFSIEKRLLVFATSRDKNAKEMLRKVLPHFEQIVLTQFTSNPRFTDPAELLRLVREVQTSEKTIVSVERDPTLAWHRVQAMASPGHMICVAGSSFIASDLRTLAIQSANLQVAAG